MTIKKYPINDWEFDEKIETAFNEWFHGDYGTFSYRSEAFYTDCEIGDVKTRQDMLKKWIYASFYSGYECAMYAKLEKTYDKIEENIQETDELLKEVEEYLEK